MPREKKKPDADPDDPMLIPDLDETEESKALVRAAKRFHKAQADRAALLKTAKEKQDGEMEKLIGLMHEAKLTKFKYKDVTAEIIASKEKAEVTLASEDDGSGDGEE